MRVAAAAAVFFVSGAVRRYCSKPPSLLRPWPPDPLPPSSLSSSRRYSSETAANEEKNDTVVPDVPDMWDTHRPRLGAAMPGIPESDWKQTPKIIDGVSIAEDIRSQIAAEVTSMKDAIGEVPGLAGILVGQKKESQIHVQKNVKACEEVGIRSVIVELPEDSSEDEIVESISRFNNDPAVHGILVQLPLPKQLDSDKIVSAVSLEKDVDGFHPFNIGNLSLRGRQPLFIPCAARACIEVLWRTNVHLMGKRVAVIGQGKVVGLPTSLLLQRHHATVTTLNAYTRVPEELTRSADIVISAAGVPNLVRGSWLKRGAVVVDFGINPVIDQQSEGGYRFVGDVCFEEALPVVSAITPVPGGMGPVTVAMLLTNTLRAAKLAQGFCT